jgi:ABC-type cobalamin/Fe3+-siderophores transport system ATPase subunit
VTHDGHDALLLTALAVLAVALFIASALIGRVPLALDAALADLWHGRSSPAALILFQLRLPRALLGLLVGMTFGLAGAVMQGLLRNPLADPGVLGVSATAAFGAVVAFYTGLSLRFSLALPFGGILGAFIAVALLGGLAGRRGGIFVLLLAGAAINSLAGALTALALNLSPNPYAVYELLFWLMGSLVDRNLDHVALATPLMAVGWVVMLSGGRARRADPRRGDRAQPRLCSGAGSLAADPRHRVCGRRRGRGQRYGRVCRSRDPASAAPAGRPRTEPALVAKHARRWLSRARRRHRRALAAHGPGVAAWRADRADRSAILSVADVTPPSGGILMRLAAEGVTVRLGTRTVLDGIDAAAEGGELVGLIGPNGAGKTSLLRVFAHLLTPAKGVVRCEGRPLGEHSPIERARRIAYLAQGAEVHWPMTVEKLVALGRLPHRGSWGQLSGDDHAAISRAMRATDIVGFRNRTLATLSGGERMRVMLARALAVEAPVLLADEPVAALDPYHQLQVMSVLKETARQGKAVIAVLHDLTLAARFCDRLLLLHDGTVLAEGAPAGVLNDCNLETAYAVAFIRSQHGDQDYLVAWDRRHA